MFYERRLHYFLIVVLPINKTLYTYICICMIINEVPDIVINKKNEESNLR
jgi:hypothetical protein